MSAIEHEEIPAEEENSDITNQGADVISVDGFDTIDNVKRAQTDKTDDERRVEKVGFSEPKEVQEPETKPDSSITEEVLVTAEAVKPSEVPEDETVPEEANEDEAVSDHVHDDLEEAMTDPETPDHDQEVPVKDSLDSNDLKLEDTEPADRRLRTFSTVVDETDDTVTPHVKLLVDSTNESEKNNLPFKP